MQPGRFLYKSTLRNPVYLLIDIFPLANFLSSLLSDCMSQNNNENDDVSIVVLLFFLVLSIQPESPLFIDQSHNPRIFSQVLS